MELILAAARPPNQGAGRTIAFVPASPSPGSAPQPWRTTALPALRPQARLGQPASTSKSPAAPPACSLNRATRSGRHCSTAASGPLAQLDDMHRLAGRQWL